MVEHLVVPGRAHCSLCPRPLRSAVVVWLSSEPYHWAFCVDCAEAIGAAASDEARTVESLGGA